MSVLIKGMEMPKNCCECRLLSGFECRALFKDITDFSVADECPLVPVPPHGRIIDADALAKFIDYGHLNNPNEKLYSENDVREMIENAPTVDAVERKRGKWQVDPSGYGFWICSACGFVSEASGADLLYNFCPHCGADMRGETNE